jgi:hypothetical protein
VLALRGFFLPSYSVKNPKEETWCQKQLADKILHALMEKGDDEIAEEALKGGCPYCGKKLHRGDYTRKPRGGPEHWDKRRSFCCSQCRRRLTPASLRFLGRRFYVCPVVVLLSAMRHGLTPKRVESLRLALGVDRRTLERWRQWWLNAFVQSGFWKIACALFMPLVSEMALPWSLLERFGFPESERLLDLLKFLAPITTPARESRVM